jgi:hypothetical protein
MMAATQATRADQPGYAEGTIPMQVCRGPKTIPVTSIKPLTYTRDDKKLYLVWYRYGNRPPTKARDIACKVMCVGYAHTTDERIFVSPDDPSFESYVPASWVLGWTEISHLQKLALEKLVPKA